MNKTLLLGLLSILSIPLVGSEKVAVVYEKFDWRPNWLKKSWLDDWLSNWAENQCKYVFAHVSRALDNCIADLVPSTIGEPFMDIIHSLEKLEKDDPLYAYAEKWFQDHFFDVDKVDTIFSPYHQTITQKINSLLRCRANRSKGLWIAQLVQPYRSCKDEVFKVLFYSCKNDDEVFDDLALWFDMNQTDVDKVFDLYGQTMGQEINSLLRCGNSRAKNLQIAKLAQPHRSNKEEIFRTLFAMYEVDAGVYWDLKEWISFYNAYIDDIPYDGVRTYGQKVDSLGDPKLVRLFAPMRRAALQMQQNQHQLISLTNNDNMKRWFTQKMGVAFLLGASVLLYLMQYTNSLNVLYAYCEKDL